MNENEAYKTGLAVRKKVLSEEYVNKVMSNMNSFTEPLQQFVIEHAWGNVWTRPGLDLKTRSMINLGMLIASNRPHELKIHLKGAVRNGVTREEMVEIFLQAGVYCGAPAAVEAFKLAQEVFKEMEAEAAK